MASRLVDGPRGMMARLAPHFWTTKMTSSSFGLTNISTTHARRLYREQGPYWMDLYRNGQRNSAPLTSTVRFVARAYDINALSDGFSRPFA